MTPSSTSQLSPLPLRSPMMKELRGRKSRSRSLPELPEASDNPTSEVLTVRSEVGPSRGGGGGLSRGGVLSRGGGSVGGGGRVLNYIRGTFLQVLKIYFLFGTPYVNLFCIIPSFSLCLFLYNGRAVNKCCDTKSNGLLKLWGSHFSLPRHTHSLTLSFIINP